MASLSAHRRRGEISGMPLVTTPAIVIGAIRYGETSKIVRLATRDHGVQSAIAKGAMRSRSRYGASLQLLSEGTATYLAKENRELHVLTGFDLTRQHEGLAHQLDRYAAAGALAEITLRLAVGEPHPHSFDLLSRSLGLLEAVPAEAVDIVGLRALWRLAASLGFSPSLDRCARDGAPVATEGPVAFSLAEGGVLCRACARERPSTQLPEAARHALGALLEEGEDPPLLDARHLAAHRRLLSRWVRTHVMDDRELPALEFWLGEPWKAA
jgi:DNA repair protein RecO (recombination protein O)